MKVLIQRVSEASVVSEGRELGRIGRGLLLLTGFGRSDSKKDLEWMVRKVLGLRIFPDSGGNMNLSVDQVDGSLLVVSQFTLHADTRRGRRPSFIDAAQPDDARMMYELFIEMLECGGMEVQSGEFGAMMRVALVNEGPVTIMVDSPSERS
jgi:D-tyrosyl-tRNA(Tyr) deacylase